MRVKLKHLQDVSIKRVVLPDGECRFDVHLGINSSPPFYIVLEEDVVGAVKKAYRDFEERL